MHVNLLLCVAHAFCSIVGSKIFFLPRKVWKKSLILKCPESSKIMSGILNPRIPAFRNYGLHWTKKPGPSSYGSLQLSLKWKNCQRVEQIIVWSLQRRIFVRSLQSRIWLCFNPVAITTTHKQILQLRTLGKALLVIYTVKVINTQSCHALVCPIQSKEVIRLYLWLHWQHWMSA